MTSREWPALPFKEWEQTCDTLHLWTQIVGKTRLKLTPHIEHWWNVTLYVNAHGLTTSPMPIGERNLEIQFDFVDHVLHFTASDGAKNRLPLFERSVSDFYHQYMACMKSFGVDLQIDTIPDEFDDRTPFEEDDHHASYDAAKVQDFHRILLKADDLFKEFRSRFSGKSSPVHFFWGSFDLAVTRFCGRKNPNPPGPSKMMREAYSEEVSSCGWWPGNRQFPEPAFYAYHVPAPAGFADEKVKPTKAYWDTKLGEFILRYDDARNDAAPENAVLDFCQSAYEAGAGLAKWDRKALERGAANGTDV